MCTSQGSGLWTPASLCWAVNTAPRSLGGTCPPPSQGVWCLAAGPDPGNQQGSSCKQGRLHQTAQAQPPAPTPLQKATGNLAERPLSWFRLRGSAPPSSYCKRLSFGPRPAGRWQTGPQGLALGMWVDHMFLWLRSFVSFHMAERSWGCATCPAAPHPFPEASVACTFRGFCSSPRGSRALAGRASLIWAGAFAICRAHQCC